MAWHELYSHVFMQNIKYVAMGQIIQTEHRCLVVSTPAGRSGVQMLVQYLK
jgi:hypothetical protein